MGTQLDSDDYANLKISCTSDCLVRKKHYSIKDRRVGVGGRSLHRFHNQFGVVSHQTVKISSTRVSSIFSTGINQCHSSIVFLGYYKNTQIMFHNFWNQVIFASLEPLGFNSFTAYFDIFFFLQPKSLVSFTVTKVFLLNYSDSSLTK